MGTTKTWRVVDLKMMWNWNLAKSYGGLEGLTLRAVSAIRVPMDHVMRAILWLEHLALTSIEH